MINANLNINGASKGKPYPTAGLQVIVYDQTYEDGGTTYLRTSTGVGIPLVSGTGLDAIWDFSVLNDDRFDKGSYIGNAFGLPEYYNFPYVGIYYDDTSEATRYYWKITDFGYAVILAQSLLVDNMFFLKATATTDTSNVIASWSGLYIYSTALTDTDLSKMKTFIGIQNDFYGDELLINGDFATGDDTGWSIVDDDWSIVDGFVIGAQIGGDYLISDQLDIQIGDSFVFEYEVIESNDPVGAAGIELQVSGIGQGETLELTVGVHSINSVFISGTNKLYLRFRLASGSVIFNYFSVKIKYENYYKS